MKEIVFDPGGGIITPYLAAVVEQGPTRVRFASLGILFKQLIEQSLDADDGEVFLWWKAFLPTDKDQRIAISEFTWPIGALGGLAGFFWWGFFVEKLDR